MIYRKRWWLGNQFAEDYLLIELVLEVYFAFTEFWFTDGDT